MKLSTRTYGFTFLGIILNSIGNSLTIVTNLGSLLWPASIVNMMHALHWTMFDSIFTEGIIVSILTEILEERSSWKEWREELIFLLPYSFFMQLFANIWRIWRIDQLPIIIRSVVDLIGLFISFAGLAMYSECAWCFHPHDALSSCLKRRLSPKFMKLFNIIVPLVIIFLCSFKNHTIFALHIGTIIGLLIQTRFTGFCQIKYDKYLHI